MKGFGNQIVVYFREIVKEVLKFGITNIVLIHHKLGTSSTPSPQEKIKVKEFEIRFKKLDIYLLDYLIITENSIFSFKNNRVYP